MRTVPPDLGQRVATAVLLAILSTASSAAADCNPLVQARIEFLEARLEERRDYARNWWRLWTVAYGTGMVFQSVSAGLEDDEGERADLVVSAIKAGYGTIRLLRHPPNARRGADPMRHVPGDDAKACERRLAVGEELLRTNARQAAGRWSWKRHAANLAINLIGGLIVTEGFDENAGWMSMGVGIAVGELQIWTHPASATEDLAEYERKFSPPSAAKPQWSVFSRVSEGVGLQLQVRY